MRYLRFRKRFLVGCVALGLAMLLPACESTSPYVKDDGSIDCGILYARRCSQCHALYEPGLYTDAQWVQKVRRYGSRAGVAPQHRPQLIAWLQANN